MEGGRVGVGDRMLEMGDGAGAGGGGDRGREAPEERLTEKKAETLPPAEVNAGEAERGGGTI